MLRRTAIIKVLCSVVEFDETVQLLAWTVGHSIELAASESEATTRCLFVFTDLAYNDDDQDDTILERLGLDIIGKIAGVLSWEVIPSDRQGFEMLEIMKDIQHNGVRQQSNGVRQQGKEGQPNPALDLQPIAISIMKHGSNLN